MNTTTQNALEVANTIKDQIGGRALYMMGASLLAGDRDSLRFSIKGSRACNKVMIKLDPSDTYTVSFWKIRGTDCRLVSERGGIYADMLHGVIETETGLALSL